MCHSLHYNCFTSLFPNSQEIPQCEMAHDSSDLGLFFGWGGLHKIPKRGTTKDYKTI